MDEREQLCGDLDELLEVYGDMVYRVALQNMGNIADAQDVAQDVFLRILKKKPQFTINNPMKGMDTTGYC